MNEIITTNYQDGFVDLNIITYCDTSLYRDNPESIPLAIPSPVNRDRRILGFMINNNNLSREYSLIKSGYNCQIDRLNREVQRIKVSDNKTKERELLKLSKKISVLLRLRRESFSPINYNTFDVLTKKISKKYTQTNTLSYKGWVLLEDEICGPFRQNEDIYIKLTKIAGQGLPYLEQQYELGRVKLDKEELILLKALKESMRIKDGTSFDDYIDRWAQRLIKEVYSGENATN